MFFYVKCYVLVSVVFMLKVSQLLSSKKYVALKVMKDSLEYRQFSQLCILNAKKNIFMCHWLICP